MWEILKGWRKSRDGSSRLQKELSGPGYDGGQSPMHRHYSTSVNFKDLSISLGPEDMEEEEGHAPTPVEESVGSVSNSPRHLKLRRLERNKLIIIMVGLPGRGKTFLCNKLVCYLNWLGHSTRLFNVGSYRRQQKDAHEIQDAAFFSKDNVHGLEARQRALQAALDALKDYLTSDEGQVAIFDATNTTNERRQFLIEQFHGKYQYLFIESICNDPHVLEQNYRYKMKYSPDYQGMDEEQALSDFKARILKYEEVYEPLEDRTRHYIKLIDMVTGRGHMDINRISGYIPGKIVFFLMQVCKAGMAQERKIWLTRHGESNFNQQGKIGGNSGLSPLGQEYAQRLPDVLMSRLPVTSQEAAIPVSVWTSTLRRTIETAEYLVFPKLRWKALDEIHAGSCDGLTYEEIAERFPEEYAARAHDKLKYRYPAGESYLDVIQRLEPVIIELEREKECVCIVSHQAVLRAIFGYFKAEPLGNIPILEIPLHALIELKPRPDGTMGIEILPVTVDPGTGLHPSLPPADNKGGAGAGSSSSSKPVEFHTDGDDEAQAGGAAGCSSTTATGPAGTRGSPFAKQDAATQAAVAAGMNNVLTFKPPASAVPLVPTRLSASSGPASGGGAGGGGGAAGGGGVAQGTLYREFLTDGVPSSPTQHMTGIRPGPVCGSTGDEVDDTGREVSLLTLVCSDVEYSGVATPNNSVASSAVTPHASTAGAPGEALAKAVP